jgi:TonB family protein
MPLNVRRFYSSLLLFLFGIFTAASAQTVPPAATPAATSTPQPTQTLAEPVQQVRTPSAAEVMRDRISKAKAYIAVRNYPAANYELESIRRESADPAVLSGVNVLLMNSYLEQGDYKRAQDFLNEAYNIQKTTKPGAAATYFAIAGQIVRGARNRVERYRALGLNPSDRTLPLEAINDMERMRETLELVVTQSKEISKDKVKSGDALALLEEASTSRSMIARDDYDASRWQKEVADFREDMASSHSVVLSAVTEAPTSMSAPMQTVAQNANQPGLIANTSYTQSTSTPPNNQPLVKPTIMSQPVNQPVYIPDQQDAQRNRVIPGQPMTQAPVQNPAPTLPTNRPADQPANKQANNSNPGVENKPVTIPPAVNTSGPSANPTVNSGPIVMGLLLPYATKQQAPVYPVAAKSMRTTGVVTVAVTVDEQGNVAEVGSVTGPGLLQAAAKDAIRKWHFKPFVRDGQPVKATGFVSFNFAM